MRAPPGPLVIMPERRLEFEYWVTQGSAAAEMSNLGSSTYSSSGQWRRLRRSREREVLWWRLEPIAASHRHRLPK